MPEPTPSGATSSKSFYTQKFAGAPMWAWAAGGGVLIGGFLWWRRRGKSQQQTAQAQNDQVPIAATTEELQAAGMYQPPDITYNLSGPTIESPVQAAASTPKPPVASSPAKLPPPPPLATPRKAPAVRVASRSNPTAARPMRAPSVPVTRLSVARPAATSFYHVQPRNVPGVQKPLPVTDASGSTIRRMGRPY
jgi:hypothetical protein